MVLSAFGTAHLWELETSSVRKLIRKRTHLRRGPNSRLGSGADVPKAAQIRPVFTREQTFFSTALSGQSGLKHETRAVKFD
jgi:hypothetical protein